MIFYDLISSQIKQKINNLFRQHELDLNITNVSSSSITRVTFNPSSNTKTAMTAPHFCTLNSRSISNPFHFLQSGILSCFRYTSRMISPSLHQTKFLTSSRNTCRYFHHFDETRRRHGKELTYSFFSYSLDAPSIYFVL